jgi:hypothetical protein
VFEFRRSRGSCRDYRRVWGVVQSKFNRQPLAPDMVAIPRDNTIAIHIRREERRLGPVPSE